VTQRADDDVQAETRGEIGVRVPRFMCRVRRNAPKRDATGGRLRQPRHLGQCPCKAGGGVPSSLALVGEFLDSSPDGGGEARQRGGIAAEGGVKEVERQVVDDVVGVAPGQMARLAGFLEAAEKGEQRARTSQKSEKVKWPASRRFPQPTTAAPAGRLSKGRCWSAAAGVVSSIEPPTIRVGMVMVEKKAFAQSAGAGACGRIALMRVSVKVPRVNVPPARRTSCSRRTSAPTCRSRWRRWRRRRSAGVGAEGQEGVDEEAHVERPVDLRLRVDGAGERVDERVCRGDPRDHDVAVAGQMRAKKNDCTRTPLLPCEKTTPAGAARLRRVRRRGAPASPRPVCRVS